MAGWWRVTSTMSPAPHAYLRVVVEVDRHHLLQRVRVVVVRRQRRISVVVVDVVVVAVVVAWRRRPVT